MTTDEAAKRFAIFGPNHLPKEGGRHPLFRFLAQFHNTLIYFLLAAALAALLLGHFIIIAVVLVNAVVGFVQEGKAEKSLNAIRDLIAPQAHLVRDGQRKKCQQMKLFPAI